MKLNEIAELVWRQLQPTSGDATTISLAEFKRTARMEYAYQLLLLAWKDKKEEGLYQIPSYLLNAAVKSVVNDRVDISDLEYFKSLPSEMWLQGIGGVRCDCRYVKSTYNQTKLMCGDDSLDDDVKTYYVQGKEIIFPFGAHTDEVEVVYAGNKVSEDVDVDEGLGAVVRERLLSIYAGKIGVNDETNNNNKTN